MRIPIFFNPLTRKKYHFYIEKAYKSDLEIVPLGYDCHPAYVLQKLHLRKHSLPFDWLNNSSVYSIEYVNKNFSDNFDGFTQDLMRNSKGNVIAKRYPYCEFLHEPNLINSQHDRSKFKRRVNRLLNLKESKRIHYINNVSSVAFDSSNINIFYASVENFVNRNLKPKDKLSIYIRFDESFDENGVLASQLESKLNDIDNVLCIRYIRLHSKYPTWGNPKHYPKLLKDLNVDMQPTWPKFYIKASS